MQPLEAISEHSSGPVPCSRTLQECSINVQQQTILPHPLQPFSLAPTKSQSKHSQSGLSGFSLPTHLALFRPLTVPFLILSIPNSPFYGNLDIFISVLLQPHLLSESHADTAGPTAVFDTFAFVLADSLLSHVPPDMFLHPFQPACTQFFTSFPQFLLFRSVDPKYLKSFAVIFLLLISVTSHFSTWVPLIQTLFDTH